MSFLGGFDVQQQVFPTSHTLVSAAVGVSI